MRVYWIISSIITFLLLGVGVYGFYFISEYVPGQLDTPSTILDTDLEESVDDEAQQREITEVIHESQKLVVKIETPIGHLGSGFLYNDLGDIITNAHVVTGTENVTVITADSRQLSGTVIGISEIIDVAVVRVPELADTPPLNLSTEKAEIGVEILALGSPFGLENTVTTGIISGVNRSFELPPYHYDDVYQISAPIAQGNSGGPLIHSKTGEVLGINSAGTEQGTIGFSIPIGNVIDLIEVWSREPMTSLPNLDLYEEDYHYRGDFREFNDEDMATYVVGYFFDSLNYRDYITAYSLLGSSLQTSTSYQSFRASYLNTRSITVDNIQAKTTDGNSLEVTVVITTEEREGGNSTFRSYKIIYTMGYENDQMKILTIDETPL
ncbi:MULTISPECIES: S1C family serine protease [Bacillaceae]|uniref:S1C family serine protease n=1 Tax=Evansella alkalicola TaxID=745819 RepID=A0ABS6JV54_9BACI|nr:MULTISPECIES: trypsin-like peptidase domain-containing protein [Bacillaceae]MBU9721574.1 S1C family serine protease [Bacillus alkalicola]